MKAQLIPCLEVRAASGHGQEALGAQREEGPELPVGRGGFTTLLSLATGCMWTGTHPPPEHSSTHTSLLPPQDLCSRCALCLECSSYICLLLTLHALSRSPPQGGLP